jgi:hypothetical protein
MTNIDKELIDKLTTLVADLLKAAQENPTVARKYVRSREFAEKSMRCIGDGKRRELVRPESIGLPVHELKAVEEPIRYAPQSDIIADNLPPVDEEKPKPIGRPKKVVE